MSIRAGHTSRRTNERKCLDDLTFLERVRAAEWKRVAIQRAIKRKVMG